MMPVEILYTVKCHIFYFILSIIYFDCLYMGVLCAWHRACVEVRNQLSGVIALFALWDFGVEPRLPGLHNKHFHAREPSC